MANQPNNPQSQNQSGSGQNNSPATSGTETKQPATTQEELSQDDGAGIRGGYGDSDQTNGLEGGQASSSRSDQQQSAQE